jgi:hypothetical protein
MVGHCGLKTWTTHSRVVHATSPRMDAPFDFKDEAIPVWVALDVKVILTPPFIFRFISDYPYKIYRVASE